MNHETMKIIRFWDQHFSNYQSRKVDVNDIKISTDLERLLVYIGDHSRSILEIGTGSGYGLLVSSKGKKVKKLVGFDSSPNAVRYLKETLRKSDIKGFEIHNKNHQFLLSLPNSSYDSIISINVLDVLHPYTLKQIIKEIDRILKPGGYLLLKFNFYISKEVEQRTNLEHVGSNVYKLNNVIRAINYTLDEWIKLFPGFDVCEKCEYDRPNSSVKDRILLLKKKLPKNVRPNIKHHYSKFTLPLL